MFPIDFSALFEPEFLLKAGVLVVSIVITVLQFFQSDSKAKEVGFFLLTLTIAGLSLTFLDQVFEAQEEVERTHETLHELQRTMERIEMVRASVEVVVSSDHPGLGLYRDRLESVESGCLRQSLLEIRDPLGRWVPLTYFVENECLPDPLNEPFASMALGFLVLDLRFFRKELSQCRGEDEPAGAQPDLSVPLQASIADETLQLVYERPQRTFILRAQKLENNFLKFDGNGRLAAVGDLAGSKMILDLQIFGLGRSESDGLSKSMRLDHIRLRFAGARSYSVDSSKGRFEMVQRDPFVRYVYCFPKDLGKEPGGQSNRR